jgi:4-amino-4-deoxy-L-arabinose transferase-like glycosyltransferase
MKSVSKQSYAVKKPAAKSPSALPDFLVRTLSRYDIVILFIVLFLVYNTVTGFGLQSGDVAPASLLPIALITNQNPYLDPASGPISSPDFSYAFLFVKGHYVSLFPIGTPVIATPVYFLSYAMGNHFSLSIGYYDLAILAKIAASVITALAGVLVYLSAQEIFPKRIAICTTFIFAFATTTWSISSQALWQQGTVELLLAALIYLVIINEKKESLVNIVLMGILSGFFVFNRPPDSVLLIPIIFSLIKNHRTKIHYYLTGALLGGLPFLFYNYSIFDNVFGGYLENLSLFTANGNFVLHFLGLLISPNVGLFIFCPVLLLSIAGFYVLCIHKGSFIRTLFLISGLAVLLQILLYSFWNTLSASGAFVFGPRYLTALVPFLCLYTGFFLDEWFGTGSARHTGREKWIVLTVVGGLIITSVCIQVIGVFFYYDSSDANKTMNDERAWNVTDSLILRSYTEGSQKIPGIYVCMLPPVPPLSLYNFQKGSPGN